MLYKLYLNKCVNLKKNNLKALTDISPKIHTWQMSIEKDIPHYMSSGKCKLK